MLMRSLLILSFLLVAIMGSGQNLRSGGRLIPEQAIMDIRHYTIALRVDPEKQSIDGYCEIQLQLLTRAPELFFDLWKGMRVSQVWVDGKKESFVATRDDQLKIRGVIPFEKGKVHVKI